MADEKKSQVDKKNIQEEKANACSHTDTKQKQPNNEGKAENTNAENTKNVKKKEDAESSEVMKKKLKKTEEELQKQKDILLRTAAEYDNYRKRTEREKTSIYTDATADTIEKILPVADNLERALKT